MPAKRTRSSTRTTANTRRKARRTTRRRRTARKSAPLALQKHTFCERSTITTGITVKANPVIADGLLKPFSLNEIAQAGEYIALFEEYQINKVVVSFRYKASGTVAVTQLPGGYHPVNEINPVLYFKVDHNDQNLESLDVLKQSSKCREHQFTNDRPNFDIVLRPACLVDVGNIHGALGVAHRPKWKAWLPMEENAIKHYGLKAYVVGLQPGAGESTAGQVEVTYKIYFTCKNNE